MLLLMLKPLPGEPAGFSLGLRHSKKEVRCSRMLDFSTLTNVNPERRNRFQSDSGVSFTLNIAPMASVRTCLHCLHCFSMHACILTLILLRFFKDWIFSIDTVS